MGDAGKDGPPRTEAKWQLRWRHLNVDKDEKDQDGGADGVVAELRTWVLYNDMHTRPTTTVERRLDYQIAVKQVATYRGDLSLRSVVPCYRGPGFVQL